MDGMSVHGLTKDVDVSGYGNSDLEDVLARLAQILGRMTVPDQVPEQGGFFRADQFEFAKASVPSLRIDRGMDFVGKPAGYGRGIIDDYSEHDYHKTIDIVRPDRELSGTMRDGAG